MESAENSGLRQQGDVTDAELTGYTEINEGDDLSKANLEGSNLSARNLRKVVFSGARLQKANLSKANLEGAKLDSANLREALLLDTNLKVADLSNATLEKADLSKAQLDQSVLRQANLREANLWHASFQNANLQDADLTGVRDLSVRQLAGANVSGAKLPEDIHKFEGLAYVDELSKQGQKVLLAMLLGCVYTWLTIGITTSANLLTNSASSPLPIIGAKIPIVGFYWVAPVILFCIYFWFQLYLQRFWKGLAAMPAFFPDGNALHEKTYPWLLNSFVAAHFLLLRDNRPALLRLEVGLCILLAYWTVPFSLLLLWERYLARHDWVGTLFQTGILSVSIVTAIVLHRLAIRTLRGEEEPTFHWGKAVQDPRTFRRGGPVFGTLAIGLLLYFLAYFCIEGNRPEFDVKTFSDLKKDLAQSFQDDGVAEALKILVPRVFELIAHVPFVSIEFQDVSTKAADWSEGTPDQFERVKGADLRSRDLRWMYGTGAFFVEAKLQHAKLQHALLVGAKLQKASLYRANLQEAQLVSADLTQANLQEANLSSANLEKACLQQAMLRDADLKESKMFGVNLRKAKLWKAKLFKADLQQADLSCATAWDVKLSGANLAGATLAGANLAGATLAGANLAGANLSGADLSEAKQWKEIDNIKHANIYNIKNPPKGFVAWARERDAVSLPPQEWHALNKGDKDLCQ